MDEVTLNAKSRNDSGKGVAHKLRAQGRLPGVFYLGNEINRPIELDAHELQLVLKEKPSIVRLQLDNGADYECVVRDLQRDPVTGKYLHVDLMGIVRGQKMTVKVPVELEGSAYGVRTQGGILQHMVHHINVECLPKDIPEKVTLDISELKIGDSLHISDIRAENIRILDEEERTVVTVLPPRVEKEVVEEVEEEVEGEGEEAEGEETETEGEDEEKRE
jgi:large subunit ribosomal protein L25